MYFILFFLYPISYEMISFLHYKVLHSYSCLRIISIIECYKIDIKELYSRNKPYSRFIDIFRFFQFQSINTFLYYLKSQDVSQRAMYTIRLPRQIKQLQNAGYKCQQPKLTELLVQFIGPQKSPYQNGIFYILLQLSHWPFKMPKIYWRTKIYHIGHPIAQDGEVCLTCYLPDYPELHQKYWGTTKKLIKIVTIIQSSLSIIKLADFNGKIISQQQFKSQAWLATKRYATLNNYKNWKKEKKYQNFGINEENYCSICLNQITCKERMTLLSCNHKFHGGCLQPWNRRICPNCRNPF